jgi:hypothetical protein
MILNRADSIDAQEAATGLRFCRDCKTLLPLSLFAKGPRICLCITHFKASRRRIVMATPLKRAINSIRSKAHQDMVRIFNQSKMSFGSNEIKELLTPEQVEGFSNISVVPLDPRLPLHRLNAVAVNTEQRGIIFGRWKKTHDAAAYIEAIEKIKAKAIEAC